MRVTILGCGTSGGVPRVGGQDGKGDWGAANPADPRNRRRRCSILVEEQATTLLVDTSPDVRAQLLDAEVGRVDAVIWTHEHADQVHGIDDLRPYALRQGAIESWADSRTYEILLRRFGYCFEAEDHGFYNPIYRHHPIAGPFKAAGLLVTPFAQDHGTTSSLGLRFGRGDAVGGGLRGPERDRSADRRCHAVPPASDPCPSRPGVGMDRTART